MSIYHMKVSVGSRGGGQSACAKSDYVSREGKYAPDSPDEDDLEHLEHGNMPAWAEDDPRAYWSAADEHERANGSLYREVQVALPVELNPDERRELAVSFAAQLTDVGEEGKLPYTLAIHKGVKENPEPGDKDNPHAHIVISERANDGIDRSAEQWFRRANTKAPEKGGAKKTRALMGKEWLHGVREKWEQMANQALERAGRDERIDHRTLVEQCAEARATSQDPEQRAEDRQRALARVAELDHPPAEKTGCKPHILARQFDEQSLKLDTAPPPGLRAKDDERQLAQVEPQEPATQERISRLELAVAQVTAAIRRMTEKVQNWRAIHAHHEPSQTRQPEPQQPDRTQGWSR